jgi:hypothetical protein
VDVNIPGHFGQGTECHRDKKSNGRNKLGEHRAQSKTSLGRSVKDPCLLLLYLKIFFLFEELFREISFRGEKENPPKLGGINVFAYNFYVLMLGGSSAGLNA